jgi:heme/copper-type cytochrome/quinol oxidase subunit 2
MPQSGHKGKRMLETIAWAVMLMLFGVAIVVIVGVAIFMLSEDK